MTPDINKLTEKQRKFVELWPRPFTSSAPRATQQAEANRLQPGKRQSTG